MKNFSRVFSGKSLLASVLLCASMGFVPALLAQSKQPTSKPATSAVQKGPSKPAPVKSSEVVAADEKAKTDSAVVANEPVILATDTIFALQEKLMGHTSSTESAAISPDGKWVATGGWDRKVLLYALDSNGVFKLSQTFTGHNGAVTCLAFDAQSTMLASGSKDFSLRVVDLATGALKFQTMDHRDALTAVEFDASGKFVMSASADGTIRLYDVANPTNNQKPRFYTYGKPVNDLITAPNGKTFYLANNSNNDVEAIDFTGKVYQRFVGVHTMPVNCLAISNNKRLLVTGGNDKSVVIWDIATAKPLKTLLGHTWKVNSVSFSRNDQYLVTTGNDGEVRVWDVNTGACVSTQKNLITAAREAVFTPNMKRLIVAGKMVAQGSTYGALVYTTPPIWHKAKAKPVKSEPVKPGAPAVKPGSATSRPTTKPTPKR
ncbi:MAG: WD40 repeat domain-containing protein [Bacteroidota bacterium]